MRGSAAFPHGLVAPAHGVFDGLATSVDGGGGQMRWSDSAGRGLSSTITKLSGINSVIRVYPWLASGAGQ